MRGSKVDMPILLGFAESGHMHQITGDSTTTFSLVKTFLFVCLLGGTRTEDCIQFHSQIVIEGERKGVNFT